MPSLLQTLVRPLALGALQLREWSQSRVTYNPLAPRVYLNPYPKYAQLRTQDPVHWSPIMDAWVLSRFADADAILRDHKRFSSDPRLRKTTRTPRNAGIENPGGQSMLFLDPPDHSRLRQLVSKAFTPGAIAALTPRIHAIVADLLDQIANPASFDLMESLAYPLPVIVMAELLGIPPEDRAKFKLWSDLRARVLEPTIKPDEIQKANQATYELDDYFREVIRQRRAHPRDDLISTLILAEEAGDKLTSNELLVMLRLLLIAGNETTTNLIGNGMLALLRHPAQLQLLRNQPDLMENAVEELLRFDTPVQVDFRIARADLEFGGRGIRAGQGVIVLLGAANHDPAVFPEPERLDITRRNASHLAFGRGLHFCLGAPLARVEARAAFAGLLQRFPKLELLDPRPAFKDNVVLRGLRELRLSGV